MRTRYGPWRSALEDDAADTERGAAIILGDKPDRSEGLIGFAVATRRIAAAVARAPQSSAGEDHEPVERGQGIERYIVAEGISGLSCDVFTVGCGGLSIGALTADAVRARRGLKVRVVVETPGD